MSKRKKETTAKTTKKAKTSTMQQCEEIEPVWKDFELLAKESDISGYLAKSLIQLFDEGNTIPFIARYRRFVTGNMSPEDLYFIKDCYDNILHLKSKLKTVVNNIQKVGKWDEKIEKNLERVTTIEELEHVYAPFKPESKRSLSERAKALGLEKPALNIFHDKCRENLLTYLQLNKEGLKTVEDIEKGIMHIIASLISSDTEILSYIRELRSSHYYSIQSKKTADKKESKTKETTIKDVNNKNLVDESKYQLYFDFKIRSDNIKPHQVLAINRGENQKVLSVKIIVPDCIFSKFDQTCADKFSISLLNGERGRIMKKAVKDCYDRLVEPLIIREVRSNLKQMAEKASMETFSKNLKQLLLANPIKGKFILGIDPGFHNGCKLAVISETGNLMDHQVIYPFRKKEKAERVLGDMLYNYNCSLIALGNGTACRETESWLSELINVDAFAPLKVTYTIVNEDGTSIYSCSPEAAKEFPDLDPFVISAVSIARRVQEPMAELVKVEPQHLGVGMYQHDLRKKELNVALSEVVSECVSFVGVDLNTASQCLLKSVAGLTDKRAAQIIQHRDENGPFTHRKELLKVKGIGEKIFQQCAGFLRVGPINIEKDLNFYKKADATKLDRTIIHPESYHIAKNLLKELNLKETSIGDADFINRVKSVSKSLNVEKLAGKFKTDRESLKMILDSLEKPLSYDLRSEYNITPVFKKGVTNISDLKVGTVLSGRVGNVTSFGCFVDIGVHVNGLIHVSKLKGYELQIGDRVEVEVLSIEVDRKRISLAFKGLTID